MLPWMESTRPTSRASRFGHNSIGNAVQAAFCCDVVLTMPLHSVRRRGPPRHFFAHSDLSYPSQAQ